MGLATIGLSTKTCFLGTPTGVWRLVAIMALWNWPRYRLGTKTCVFDTQKGAWRVEAIMAEWDWSCRIGHNIVWAQEKVSWVHKKVFRDWWLLWPCCIGHDIVWVQMGPLQGDQRFVAIMAL